jgi:phage tail-like protein
MTSRPNDPIPAFRFEVELDDLPVAGFSEISGLSVEVKPHEYAEGGINNYIHRFPGPVAQGNITLKRGIVDIRLWNWFYDLTLGKVQLRNASIRLRDPSGREVLMEWYIRESFPIKWTGPELNATQNSVAVETLELAHQGLQRRQ